MRVLAALLMCVAVLAAGAAWAGDQVLPYQRTVEFRVVEPCDVSVMAGEVVLAWDDCGGSYAIVGIEAMAEGTRTFSRGDGENPHLDFTRWDYPHPLTLLLYAGTPDFSELDPHTYASFFCNKCCTTKRPDVYCASFDACEWYCYYTEAEWCGETVCVYACLPGNMALDIVDIY